MSALLLAIAAGAVAWPAYLGVRVALARRVAARRPSISHPTNELLDEPIRSRRSDSLGRVAAANRFASELRESLPGESAVLAVTGPWGVGKTSFLNMVAEALEDEPSRVVIRFNPWLFTHAEHLLQPFFQEVATQLRIKLPGDDAASAQMLKYADSLSPFLWVPGVGVWFGRASNLLGAIGRGQQRRAAATSAESTRRALVSALDRLEEPIFVFIDDVDRLDGQEVREVLRLVRLVAHLPNVIHVLAFDEQQVRRAVSTDENTSSAYLEKIVQRTVPLTYPAEDRVSTVLFTALNAGLEGVATGPLHADRWPDIFAEIVHPLVRNLRDVKRYVTAAIATARALGEDIALADVLALEAVRVFMPHAYGYIAVSPGSFARASGGGFGMPNPPPDPELERFLESDSRVAILRAVAERLFPGTQAQLGGTSYDASWVREWRKDLRVADPTILRFYLHREITPDLVVTRTSRIAASALMAGDGRLFAQILEAVPNDALEDVVESLESYESDFSPAIAEAGVPVLSKYYGVLPERERGLFQLDPDLKIDRVILRLLRAAPAEEVARILESFALDATTLFGRYRLTSLVGHAENVGHGLVTTEYASALEGRLRAEILSAPASALGPNGALRLLYWVFSSGNEDEQRRAASRASEPDVFRSLLLDAVSESRSQSMGSRAVLKEARLAWEPLVEVVGNEETIRGLVARLVPEAAESDDVRNAIELADRYLKGWRPERI